VSHIFAVGHRPSGSHILLINSSGDLGCNYPCCWQIWTFAELASIVSEAFMIGDIEVSSLKGAMDVRWHSESFHIHFNECASQLWLDNRAGMEYTLSSTAARFSSTISGLYNSFLGQSHSQARLNVIASYDQSNELFKVRSIDMKYKCFLIHFS
jgi:hypothetical protein